MYSSNHSQFISLQFKLNDLIHYNPCFHCYTSLLEKILPSLHNYDTKKVITKQTFGIFACLVKLKMRVIRQICIKCCINLEIFLAMPVLQKNLREKTRRRSSGHLQYRSFGMEGYQCHNC